MNSYLYSFYYLFNKKLIILFFNINNCIITYNIIYRKMSELNIRKAEALAGFYCHPDIIKFIYNVLLNFTKTIGMV